MGKVTRMLWLVLIALAVWVVLSFPGAVIVGRAIRGPADSGLREVLDRRGPQTPVG